MLMAASSSCAPPQVKKYDVFLSFRGEDTRNNFTSHLYAALCRKRIKTFIDNQLIRGDEILSSVLNTIEASKISIIIFSENYGSSRWCLQELQHILECKRTCGQIVVPVFYHVDPSHIRNQKDSFGYAFEKLRERFEERIDELKRWEAALEEAANLSGWPFYGERPESALVESIVRDILKRLNKLSTSYNNDLVGIEFAIQETESLLTIESDDICIVGIWGMGGIGKTTIGHVVFNRLLNKFDGNYFFENVREESDYGRLMHVKNEFISTILEDTQSNIGLTFTKERLSRMKVLIAFDDVTSLVQIEKLIGDLNCFGPGSRIIITTRDKQVFKNCGVSDDKIYKIDGLRRDDALQLFSKYAFRQDFPAEDYKELSNKVLNYTKGYPLALKVLGSSLFSKGKEIWEIALYKLEKGPPFDVYKVLKISYDGLDKEEQDIFLDIACFFKWEDKHSVIKILNACDFSIKHALSILMDKNLITISENVITMHDLLEEMGKQIIREESKNDLRAHSRLWHHQDIHHVLTKTKGTKAIEGIRLNMSKTKEINLHGHTFSKMRNLRFFDFCCSYTRLELNYSSNFSSCSCNEENSNIVRASQDLEFAFSDLIYFRWHGYPLTSLPSRFNPINLIALIMPHSEVRELWMGVQDLGNLKHINLSYSKYLIKIPDLSQAPNLESLILQGCIELIEISSSIQNLNKLVTLNLRYCESLDSLPRFIRSESLDDVSLFGCSNLSIAPTFPCNMRYLDLGGTAIREFPLIIYPSRLSKLNLENCSRLESLGSNFCGLKSLQCLSLSSCSIPGRLPESLGNLSSLTYLSLVDCGLTELPDDLGQLHSLKELYLHGNNFRSLPASIENLSKLSFLDLSNCEELLFLPNFPEDLKAIDAYNCISLIDLSLPHAKFFKLNLSNCFELNHDTITKNVYAQNICSTHSGNMSYPGNEIPEWFMFQTPGSCMTIQLPPDYWDNKILLGFAMCAVVEFPDQLAAYDLSVPCHFMKKSEDGDEIEVQVGYLDAWSRENISYHDYSCKDLTIQKDHVFLGFNLFLEEPHGSLSAGYDENIDLSHSNQTYIKFDAKDDLNKWSYNVKKCGVHFVYVTKADPTGEDAEEEFSAKAIPRRKRKKSGTPRDLNLISY